MIKSAHRFSMSRSAPASFPIVEKACSGHGGTSAFETSGKKRRTHFWRLTCRERTICAGLAGREWYCSGVPLALVTGCSLDERQSKLRTETQRRTDLIQEICAPRSYCSKLYFRNQGLRDARLCSGGASHYMGKHRSIATSTDTSWLLQRVALTQRCHSLFPIFW